ncbi:glycerophosphodiester phosphodiesterase family protein [Terriglobus albidus]|uniref:Glycerophosphodiester phosphodiesterase family protein n=2 Tax=Terriglobus albidus TaxID=1592106 RepID=A0A5B9EI88_9BACT|nr:glycerophosphodiester phosphodiesterase family protein [Terriglobus albidus]
MHTSLGKLLLCCISLSGMAAAQTAWQPLESDGKIRVIAHRGEHLHHPENTLAAFQAAIDVGADYFELDVRTTSDGKLVLMHDSTLDRTTNGTGEVHKHTFDEIRALDAGSKFSPAFAGTKVPTFEEALDLAHGKINIYVDTKYADPQQLVDTIVKHDMQDHVVIYGNPFFLYDVRKIRPSLKVMPEAITSDICKFLVRGLQPQVIAFDANDFKDPVIDCAKAAHASIFVDRLGDADTPEVWQKALDLGAAGIQTNRPAELADWLRQHKLATH